MSSKPQYYLAIDSGTQSIRCAIIDDKGNFVDIEQIHIEPCYSPQKGYAEQKAKYFWEMLCKSSKTLLERQNELKHQIVGVSVSCQRNVVINLDKDGNPLRPAIHWLDQRKAKMDLPLPSPIKWGLKALGIYGLVESTYRDSEYNWLRQNQSEILEKTHKMLFLSGFYHYKFTGKFVESKANVVGYVPYDYKKHAWYSEKNLFRRLSNIPLSMLPELVNPGEIIGEITELASMQTGIPKGLPFVSGATDKASEVLGCGVVKSDSVACISLGTTSSVQTVSEKYQEVIPFMPLYPSAISGKFNSEVTVLKGFWMVTWFKEEFSHQERELARTQNIPAELLLDKFLTDIPAGSHGLITQPYWETTGFSFPGPEAKGAFVGFCDAHKRPHLYKSIIEGLAYGLREGLEKTQNKLGKKISVLRIAGGGSQSDNIMQIMADVFGIPTERPHSFQATLLGCAIGMAVTLGRYKDHSEAVENMVRIQRRFEPIPKNVEVYQKLYTRIYLKMYKQLKPLYKEIAEIGG
ncbi:MAG: carbohydrate kinase [Flavobacteriaceae bacterium]|nr:MAG: carbohydrate kinase [Flavobacteriaceae bacterium]